MKPPLAATGALLTLALVAGGCTGKSDRASEQPSDAIAAAASGVPAPLVPPAPPLPKIPIPAEFIGNWKLSEISCDKDSGEKTPEHLPQVFLQIHVGGNWDMNVEGFPMEGTVEVHPSRDRTEIQLHPGSLDFRIVDGGLVNDSEGDAPYVCDRYFKREQS